jgi:hypothetical protein
MKIKNVISYNLNDDKRAIIIYYLVIAAVISLIGLGVAISDENSTNVAGLEMSTAVFLFVVGLNSFKENFLFLSTNGVSRKTQFSGFVACAALVAAIMAVIDNFYVNVSIRITNYTSFFSQFFNLNKNVQSVKTVVLGLVWSIAVYLLALMLGYFITILYYRMSRMWKIIVSVGVPVVLLTILPIIDSLLTGGVVYGAIGKFFAMTIGYRENPLISTLSSLVFASILGAISYLLMRRAALKE